MPTKQKSIDLCIRWMIARDMPAVVEIAAAADFEWSEELFQYHLRFRNVIGMVAEHGEKVVGFMVYALEKDRLVILNFAVHTQWRRLGVGRQMVEKLAYKLSAHRRTRIAVSAHENNLGFQLFLRELGFRAERVDGEFYCMARRFSDDSAETPPNRIAAFLE